MHVFPLLIQFWTHFWLISGSILDPKSVPKFVQQIEKSSYFLGLFFSGLKALQVPLESHLEPLMLVLSSHKTREIETHHNSISDTP